MKKLYFGDLADHYGEDVILKGFVDKIRDLQYVQFVVLRDSTGKIQVTIEKNDDNKPMNDTVSALTKESTVTVKGKLLESPKVRLRGMEVIPTAFEVTSKSAEELPIDILDYNNTSKRDLRLDNRFLDLRVERNHLIFDVQTTIESTMRHVWEDEGFIELHSPKILGTASESGAEVFKLDYFGREVYLAQSPQFYKQMAMAAGFNNVFEIGPVFRAEKSHTAYHANEFTSVDMEMSWIDSHEDVMDHEEMLMKRVMEAVKAKHGEAYERNFKREIVVPQSAFPRIPFEKAKAIIRENYKYSGEKDYDFDRREEELIGLYARKELGSDFVFVTDYPFEARPFYHMVDEAGKTLSFDLLYRGVEITTGAQREHRIDVLEKQAEEKGIDLDSLDFYLEFFRYGMPPHGGFGFGLTRFMMKLFDVDSIRDVTYLYRGPNRITP